MAKEHKFNFIYPHLKGKAPRKFKNLKLGGIVTKTFCNGLWSDEERKVKLKEASVRWADPETPGYGELRVRFDTKTWNPDRHGLIYTDRNWIKDLRKILMKKGFSKKAVSGLDYTEQGMQGDDYVSIDTTKAFLTEWRDRDLTVSEV